MKTSIMLLAYAILAATPKLLPGENVISDDSRTECVVQQLVSECRDVSSEIANKQMSDRDASFYCLEHFPFFCLRLMPMHGSSAAVGNGLMLIPSEKSWSFIRDDGRRFDIPRARGVYCVANGRIEDAALLQTRVAFLSFESYAFLIDVDSQTIFLVSSEASGVRKCAPAGHP